jgi:hypothetical protein
MFHSKRRLELNIQLGINLSINFQSLAVKENGYENLILAENDCRNYFVRIKKKNQLYHVIDIVKDVLFKKRSLLKFIKL